MISLGSNISFFFLSIQIDLRCLLLEFSTLVEECFCAYFCFTQSIVRIFALFTSEKKFLTNDAIPRKNKLTFVWRSCMRVKKEYFHRQSEKGHGCF